MLPFQEPARGEQAEAAETEKTQRWKGAAAWLEDEAGEEQRWRIVGPDEFDLSAGKLSMDSPMARSLLGKGVDDEVLVHTPSGEQMYYVTDISYNESK